MFSNIDLRSMYHQMCIEEENIHKASYQKRYKHYEFVVITFGLTNALTMFMCLMNYVFHP